MRQFLVCCLLAAIMAVSDAVSIQKPASVHQKRKLKSHHHHKKVVKAAEAKPQRFAEVEQKTKQAVKVAVASGATSGEGANSGEASGEKKPQDCANTGCEALKERTIPEGLTPVVITLQAGGVPTGTRAYDQLPLNDKLATQSSVLNEVSDFIGKNSMQFQDVQDLVTSVCSGPLCGVASGDKVLADQINDPFKSAFLPPGIPIDTVV